MQKIHFNNRHGLTRAVVEEYKTKTRRIATFDELKEPNTGWLTEQPEAGRLVLCDGVRIVAKSQYKMNEILAVAQSYKDLKLSYIPHIDEPDFKTCTKHAPQWGNPRGMKGWSNKMFVRADLMPYRIKITDIKAEKLQDISDEDCLKEGIIRRDDMINSRMEDVVRYTFENSFVGGVYKTYATPREAFAALIERPGIGHKGDWSKNPWVFAYTFKLIK